MPQDRNEEKITYIPTSSGTYMWDRRNETVYHLPDAKAKSREHGAHIAMIVYVKEQAARRIRAAMTKGATFHVKQEVEHGKWEYVTAAYRLEKSLPTQLTIVPAPKTLFGRIEQAIVDQPPIDVDATVRGNIGDHALMISREKGKNRITSALTEKPHSTVLIT